MHLYSSFIVFEPHKVQVSASTLRCSHQPPVFIAVVRLIKNGVSFRLLFLSRYCCIYQYENYVKEFTAFIFCNTFPFLVWYIVFIYYHCVFVSLRVNHNFRFFFLISLPPPIHQSVVFFSSDRCNNENVGMSFAYSKYRFWFENDISPLIILHVY